ncbi:putative alkaline dihydroceramidase Ydc1 [Saitoella complicata NRRL Y-17804]|uniref:Alkaline ceramidase n=1 Tax=Saitoella complicata (strain BCRC 22490 / CBS 7301 / JCM 7358 / NBRC 10748 / NRRL Y-17804) TaxID=698492 RepID=A0A0E9N9U1_SAICN|nr:putative alkaline dihydroceramidase Ydc1 [Saitoella complicata NRRL Y-17804]ODQ50434.1 putative alkaline dihydroceramidase Ydc1 [Saitoella complicata NRRL Y-17804]GAO46657.1 hypothetical protein G7K_0883-t1 [Saitoella complicata NRRL Y-17804]
MYSSPWPCVNWAYGTAEREGWWGPPSATIDWCEENYVISSFIAEFINTTTNLGFMVLALFLIVNTIKQGHETRMIITALGFMLVGLGSFLFHASLLYKYQLLDELPMVYSTCIQVWSVFEYETSKTVSVLIGLGVFAIAAIVTFVYLIILDPMFHQVAYAALSVAVLGRSIWQMYKEVKPAKSRKELLRMVVTGISSFLFGFLLWNIDNEACSTLRSWRHVVGIPWGFLLELHGWWHIFTGLGVYYYIVFLEYLRIHLLGTQDQFACIWSIGGIIPHVDRIKPKPTKSTANGFIANGHVSNGHAKARTTQSETRTPQTRSRTRKA